MFRKNSHLIWIVLGAILISAGYSSDLKDNSPSLVISIVFGSSANYSFKIQESKEGKQAVYSLDDPGLHPNSIRQQYILGQWYQYSYKTLLEPPKNKEGDQERTASKRNGSLKLTIDPEEPNILLKSFASPQPRHSMSAISFIRGLVDHWKSPKVHPEDKSSESITVPPRKDYKPPQQQTYFALAEEVYPFYTIGTQIMTELDQHTADRLTLSNWKNSCSGAYSLMLHSLSRFVKDQKLEEYVNKIREELGIRTDGSNILLNKKGRLVPGINLLDSSLENFDKFIKILGDGQEISPQILNQIRSLYVVRWEGLFYFRNKESFKIFTDGIANYVIALIQGLILKEDNHNFSEYDTGFVSFHVTDQMFMSFFEGLGLLQTECNLEYLKTGTYSSGCITAPHPGSSITLEIHKSKNQGKLDESWVKILFNGREIKVGCEDLSIGNCLIETFLDWWSTSFLAKDYNSLCLYGNEKGRSVIKGLLLGGLILMVFFLLIILTIFINMKVKYQTKLKVLKILEAQRFSAYFQGQLIKCLNTPTNKPEA